MLKLKLQYFGHLMQKDDIGKDSDARKDGKQKEKRAAEDETDSITDSTDMNLSKLQEKVRDREAYLFYKEKREEMRVETYYFKT